jgi:hypothetical protein
MTEPTPIEAAVETIEESALEHDLETTRRDLENARRYRAELEHARATCESERKPGEEPGTLERHLADKVRDEDAKIDKLDDRAIELERALAERRVEA